VANPADCFPKETLTIKERVNVKSLSLRTALLWDIAFFINDMLHKPARCVMALDRRTVFLAVKLKVQVPKAFLDEASFERATQV